LERSTSEKKKLVKENQLKELKPLDGLKPLKLFPDDPDPAKQITRCPKCNAEIGQQNGVFNCPKDGMVTPIFGGDYERKVPDKGVRPKGFGPKDVFVNPGIPFNRAAQSKDHLKRNKKDHDMAEHNEDTVKEVFISDPLDQCLEPPKRKNRKYDDKLDVMRSCEDLAIDG